MKYLLFVLLLISSITLSGRTYYVSVSGNDTNPGTIGQPWATFQKAFSTAAPGDTVFFRGGVYYSTAPNVINPKNWPTGIGNSGTAGSPIVYMGYPADVADGNKPILDCILHCSETPGRSYNSAISLNYVEHIKFKDIDIRNSLQCDGTITGAVSSSYSRNLTFENMTISDVSQRGMYIRSGAWKSWYDDGGTAQAPYWPDEIDTTIFRNIDLYNLCDTLSMTGTPPVANPGNAADGYKCNFYRGNYILWEGCRVWNYSDDGWDVNNINGAHLVLNNCWVMSSNKYASIEEMSGGMFEGNGLKFTALHSESQHQSGSGLTITNSLVMYCGGIGIASNFLISSRGSLTKQLHVRLYNNTVYRNGSTGVQLGSFSGFTDSTIIKNVLSYAHPNYLVYGPANFRNTDNSSNVFESHNTSDWIGGFPGWALTDTVSVTDADFTTTDSLTLVSLFTAPRQEIGRAHV